MSTPSSTLVNRPKAVPPAAPAPDFGPPAAPGEVGRLAHYRVVRALGAGGMGAVFLAVDESLGRRVALKVMLPEHAAEPGARERFLREARAAAAVNHDNVVTIFQVGEDGGMPFIAMELLAGTSLAAYLIEHGRLTAAQALRIGREAAAGLDAAHARGLIHRDVKPANIWLEAPHGRVKILDFGLAKSSDERADGLTATGQVVGTPGFMSPEQARGRPLDARSDLFSLGTVLYLLVTGQMPFDGRTTMAVLTALAVDEPIPVRQLAPDVPEAFAAEIHRLLSKRPADRLPTAGALAERLARLERDLTAPTPTPAEPQVVYVPVQVSVPLLTPPDPAATAFADLTAADSAPAERAEPRRPAARPSVMVWAGAAGAVLLAAVAVGVVAFALRPRADRPAEPAAKADPPKLSPVPRSSHAPPADKPDPDRRVAEWMIGYGGDVISTDDKVIAGVVPTYRFKLLTLRIGPLQPVTNADLDLFRDLTELRGIGLARAEIDDAGFEKLSRFPHAANYTDLHIPSPRLTSAAMPHAARFRSLRVLGLLGSAVDDRGAAELADSGPPLTYLLLTGTRVTDAGVAALARMPVLATLEVANTQVTDTGLKELAGAPRLERLNVEGCRGVTDAGLRHLRGWKFVSVNVRGTCVTAAGVAELRAANPGGEIVSDVGAVEQK
jgi:hypothetical protein